MGPTTAPNEPLFFLHHANVDRVWAKVRLLPLPLFWVYLTESVHFSNTQKQWQGRNETRLNDYSGFQDTGRTIPASITDTMPVLELSDTTITVKDHMDTQAGPLCYTYSSM